MSAATTSTVPAVRQTFQRLIEWVTVIIFALGAAFLIKTYLIESYVVPSGSMLPTIQPWNRILVDKLSFDFGHHAKAGQIVVFHEAPTDPETGTPVLVKRLIGLPGQTLRSLPDGGILVDGRPLREPWLTGPQRADPGPNICSPQYSLTDCHDGVLRLPAGEYFMMGDNRGFSYDSRYWGPISGSRFIGRVFVRIWPLSRLHWF